MRVLLAAPGARAASPDLPSLRGGVSRKWPYWIHSVASILGEEQVPGETASIDLEEDPLAPPTSPDMAATDVERFTVSSRIELVLQEGREETARTLLRAEQGRLMSWERCFVAAAGKGLPMESLGTELCPCAGLERIPWKLNAVCRASSCRGSSEEGSRLLLQKLFSPSTLRNAQECGVAPASACPSRGTLRCFRVAERSFAQRSFWVGLGLE